MLSAWVNPLNHGHFRAILGLVTLADLFVGFVIGFPMMIAVGPISVLLFDQGLERGIRTAAPAALGVAGADLTLASIASFGGVGAAHLLGPVAPVLTAAAVVVLLVLTVQLARAARADLRRARSAAATRHLAPAGGGADAHVLDEVEVDEVDGSPVERSVGTAFGSLTGLRLGSAFFGLTLVNPLTVVLFASVVVAGGRGIGTVGWAVGMALASLVAHGGFMVAGGLLRTQLGPVASGRLRLAAAVFMGALAVHFALG